MTVRTCRWLRARRRRAIQGLIRARSLHVPTAAAELMISASSAFVHFSLCTAAVFPICMQAYDRYPQTAYTTFFQASPVATAHMRNQDLSLMVRSRSGNPVAAVSADMMATLSQVDWIDGHAKPIHAGRRAAVLTATGVLWPLAPTTKDGTITFLSQLVDNTYEVIFAYYLGTITNIT